METQLFAGTKPVRKKLQPVENFLWKPKGGLWTSTYADGTSGWLEWCEREEFEKPEGKSWWLLTPSPDAKVFSISSGQNYDALMEEFGCELHPDSPLDVRMMERTIDWEAFAKKWDGLHLTEGMMWRYRLKSMFLYGWDCESTCWTRWVFDSVKKLDNAPTAR